MQVPSFLFDLWRRHFGGYEIVDPRPLAKENPYTFFLPSVEDIGRLKSGHVAKLIFRGIPAGREWDSERMWVQIVGQRETEWTGKLDNMPRDMPQLRLGDTVGFHPWQIIQTHVDDVGEETRREYWERCLIDPLVLSGAEPVHYIERVEPEPLEEGEKFADSGWRIFGRDIEMPGADDQELEMECVALGRVLNLDDSWLHLIDEPVGAAFRRDFQAGGYSPYQAR